MAAFVLDLNDLESLAPYLGADEFARKAENAGEGNMNCTLRVYTSKRTLIFKQSRPWVVKYPTIAAPVERTTMEAAFYREVAVDANLAPHLPRLLRFFPADHLLLLEDLERAQDFTFLYEDISGVDFTSLVILTQFLAALHSRFRRHSLAATFRNPAMRMLNHEHVFDVPLRRRNGIDLDSITPGLKSTAESLVNDSDYVKAVTSLGDHYLDDTRASCLIHGDYFPGSWLRSAGQVYVIDPEFCFFGPPEWDMGVMTAHLYLAGFGRDAVQSLSNLYVESSKLDIGLTRQFAGVEMMRRLIGVAQLPLSRTLEEKKELLQQSRAMVLEEGQL
jgi:5-methylthioribose kinase